MRENLIAFIKSFSDAQDGSHHRDEITVGKRGEITLTFGYGYHNGDKVIVWWYKQGDASNSYEPVDDHMHALSVEDAVDEFLKFYKLS